MNPLPAHLFLYEPRTDREIYLAASFRINGTSPSA